MWRCSRFAFAAIEISSSQLTVTNCLFQENSHHQGLLQAVYQATIVVHNTTFARNIGSDAGIIYLSVMSSGNISNCQFNQNEALEGAALVAEGSKVFVINTTFWNNVAAYVFGSVSLTQF